MYVYMMAQPFFMICINYTCNTAAILHLFTLFYNFLLLFSEIVFIDVSFANKV